MTDNEMSFDDRIRDGARTYGVYPDRGVLSRYRRYFDLLADWNTRVNLVSGRDMERFAGYHVLDALKVASVFDFSGVHSMMDFGSGAGVPGIPIALAFPDIDTVLVESRRKRFAFLEAACASIPVPNARAVLSRIESLDHAFHGSFDVVVTRATVSLSDFFRLASPFLSERGSLIAIKGDSVQDEAAALETVLDHGAFSVTLATPVAVETVRSGTIVITTRR